jgi:hypothetical protein
MATYTNLDNEIFARNALEGFVKTLLPFNVFSTNFSPDPVQKGNNVLVPLIGAITATTFSAYNICGGTMSVVTVTIDKHKVAQVGQSDLTAASSSMAQLERFAFQQGAGLAVLVLQDVMSLVTTANFAAAHTTTLANFDVYSLRQARLLLNQSNVPVIGRGLMVDCAAYDVLLGVTNFVQAHMFGDRGAIADARIPRAMGFDMYELNSVFTSTASVMAFAAHASAIAIAMRYLQPQPGHKYLDARPITHPETGLTIGLRDHYDENTGTRYINLEANYGYTTGITNAGRIIKRAD